MNLHLIRHGQAGTRLDYDTLSSVGRHQASLLGKYLHQSGAAFTSMIAGGLKRQQETASLASAELAAPPVLATHTGWNEFDLDGVYQGIAPKLAAHSADFRKHWEAVQAAVERHGADEHSVVNRRWSPADEMVVRAWVEGRFTYDGESWVEFKQRIRNTLLRTLDEAHLEAAIFTSATPTAIAVGEALGLNEAGIFRLAATVMNSSFSELRWRNGRLRLFSFNNAPHLLESAMRTHR